MRQAERDNDQLGIILDYCERMDKAFAHFGDDYDLFEDSEPFQDACSLCLIQMGEAVNRLSDEFKKGNPHIDWKAIYGMRCRLVHGYDNFDAEIAWDAMKNYLPSLRSFCEERYQEDFAG